MSLLQEVIEQYCQPEEKSETPKRPGTKSAKRGFDTSGTDSPERFDKSDGPSIQSVDTLRSKLLRERRAELRLAAGDDWDEFSVPAKILGFADSLAIQQIRESNNVPDHFTATTECEKCGPVPIFPGCPPQVNGCPWCISRIKGMPVPMLFQPANRS